MVPLEIGLEYHETDAFITRLLSTNILFSSRLSTLILSRGVSAAFLPAVAELCIFAYAMKDGFTWYGAMFFSAVSAVQYLLVEGSALNSHLKYHAFKLDKEYVVSRNSEGKSRIFTYLTLSAVSIINILAASTYLIPIFSESHHLFSKWFDNIKNHDHRAIPVYFASGILCTAYLGGQLCLQGNDLKRLFYHSKDVVEQLKLMVTVVWRQSYLKRAASMLVLSTLMLLNLVVTVCASSYFLVEAGRYALDISEGGPFYLYVLSVLFSLPNVLQHLNTRVMSSLMLLLRGSDAFEDYQNEHSNQDAAQPIQKTPAISFCRYYIILMGVGFIAATKMAIELSSPSESALEVVGSYLAGGAVAFFVQLTMLDLLPFFNVYKKDRNHACTGRQILNVIKIRTALFISAVAIGIGSQYLLNYVFNSVMSKGESARFRAESSGGLIQGLYSTFASLIIHHCYYPFGDQHAGSESETEISDIEADMRTEQSFETQSGSQSNQETEFQVEVDRDLELDLETASFFSFMWNSASNTVGSMFQSIVCGSDPETDGVFPGEGSPLLGSDSPGGIYSSALQNG